MSHLHLIIGPVAAGKSTFGIVLEVGLIEKEPRQAFYSRIDEQAWPHTVYVIDADRDVRRQRVMDRNRDRGETFHVEVPLEFFEFASDRWQPPGEDEQADRDMLFITT
jgi:deoxyadenosine/deoxycytidine kinase